MQSKRTIKSTQLNNKNIQFRKRATKKQSQLIQIYNKKTTNTFKQHTLKKTNIFFNEQLTQHAIKQNKKSEQLKQKLSFKKNKHLTKTF